MEKLEIYSSKKKSFLLLIGSLLLMIFGFELFTNSENYIGHRFTNPFFIIAIGILSIIFFGLGVYISLRQLIKNKLFLSIDENGINFNPKKSEILNWHNIKGFSEIKIQSQKLVLIEVDNPDYWIENEKNQIRKKIIEYNFNKYGSPFCLSAVSMQINHKELMNLLHENLKKYKNQYKDAHIVCHFDEGEITLGIRQRLDNLLCGAFSVISPSSK